MNSFHTNSDQFYIKNVKFQDIFYAKKLGKNWTPKKGGRNLLDFLEEYSPLQNFKNVKEGGLNHFTVL